ncbi:MAG: hypothetical protein HRU26_17475 [Psychroserpens sp.]|nr:hypothetical protein [Psychroserpens sp.]
MKNLFVTLLSAFVFLSFSQAQVFEPVKWDTSIEQISEDEFDLISVATIDKGWHLYSQNVPEDGPIPTSFNYGEATEFDLIDKTKEEEGKTIDDPVFQMKIKFFEDRAEFRQRVKRMNKVLSEVQGEVEFMVCDDTKCLPPQFVDLVFKLPPSNSADDSSPGLFQVGQSETSQILEPVKWTTKVEKVSDKEYILVSEASIDKGWKLYSQNVPEDGPIPTEFMYTTNKKFELVGTTSEAKGKEVEDKVFKMNIKFFKDKTQFRQTITLLDQELTSVSGEVGFMACDDEKCLTPTYVDLDFDLTNTTTVSESSSSAFTSSKKKSTRGLWSIFFVAFLSGFVALLTPCVFPMIPMTVSFFIKQSKSKAKGIRNAIIYGLSIIIIYVLLGTIITAIFGADALNALATNVWFNLIFFLLLVVFAISFLGAFEIVLPNSWANKADRQADRGGLVGIFFMALALAIVSFSCTGPIVGSILELVKNDHNVLFKKMPD